MIKKKFKIGLVNEKLYLVPTPVPTIYPPFPPTTCSPPPTPSDAIHRTSISDGCAIAQRTLLGRRLKDTIRCVPPIPLIHPPQLAAATPNVPPD